MNRGFRDRDFLETNEGMIFCVVGNVHPKGRVLAYLKYVMSNSASGTIWSRQGVAYQRMIPIYSAIEVKRASEYLRKRYPEYIVHDRYKNIEFTEIPIDRIRTHYKPEERLKEIINEGPKDQLEELVIDLVNELSNESGVPIDSFGVTGSILLKIHNPRFSDIDLVVYGSSNAQPIKEALLRLYDDERSGFSRLSGDALTKWVNEVVTAHPFTADETRVLLTRYRWNKGIYRGRPFSIHPVKVESEVTEEWEQRVHKPLCLATIRARVIDSRDSYFMPAVYQVRDVYILDGCKPQVEVKQVVSYESLYMDIAQEGDEILVHGKIEEVHDLKTGDVYAQVVVGTYEAQGKDFIKPLKMLNNGRH
ncbi:hypothetical protein [Vulcanisaeta sp. JCM 14467]|uniref:hypothetical protein n=1 Tax=Vulcanisaeta sp. JCM 14467 TaxID=1295370 RepID=UPI0006CFD15D|nr:hypothetical protein [Vulcanisaeta sp. JCM 14467]